MGGKSGSLLKRAGFPNFSPASPHRFQDLRSCRLQRENPGSHPYLHECMVGKTCSPSVCRDILLITDIFCQALQRWPGWSGGPDLRDEWNSGIGATRVREGYNAGRPCGMEAKRGVWELLAFTNKGAVITSVQDTARFFLVYFAVINSVQSNKFGRRF